MKETITTTKYKICPICNTKFIASITNKKYCCKECAKIAIKEREKTPAYIERRKKYAKSKKRKISIKKYLASEKGKASIKKYLASEKGKASVEKARKIIWKVKKVKLFSKHTMKQIKKNY